MSILFTVFVTAISLVLGFNNANVQTVTMDMGLL